MKKILITLLSSIFLLSARDLEIQLDSDHISTLKFEKMLRETQDAQAQADLVAEVLKSGRLDLIESCFRDESTAWKLTDAVSSLENFDLRDKIVLMMLNTDSPFWADDMGQYVGGVTSRNVMREPFISTIRRNIREVSTDDESLANRQARLKLSRELGIVIKGKTSTPPPSQIERIRKRPNPSDDTHLENLNLKHNPIPGSSKRPEKAEPISPKKIFNKILISGLAFLAALAIGLAFWKR